MNNNLQRPITPEKHKHKRKHKHIHETKLFKESAKRTKHHNRCIDRNDKQTKIQYSCIS